MEIYIFLLPECSVLSLTFKVTPETEWKMQNSWWEKIVIYSKSENTYIFSISVRLLLRTYSLCRKMEVRVYSISVIFQKCLVTEVLLIFTPQHLQRLRSMLHFCFKSFWWVKKWEIFKSFVTFCLQILSIRRILNQTNSNSLGRIFYIYFALAVSMEWTYFKK